ncbi:MAG: PEP-CTERM sorting domain-containing protein [Rhizobacter sp.]|nr:PEP-CTERM sorting domain-containing protein [Rhizobacter sp.]
MVTPSSGVQAQEAGSSPDFYMLERTMASRSASFRFAAPIVLVLSATAAVADPIDLTPWTALTLDFPGGQSAGRWVLEPGATAVKQVVNADPSFFLNNVNQTSIKIDGTWQVVSGGDDDYMGFVFGYQNSSNFYAFDWKKSGQSYVGQYAAEGMTIKRFTGATGDGLVDLSLAEFWENEDNLGDMTVLATNHATDKGWVDGRLYDFHLDYNVVAGQFTIVVKDGATTLWDKTVVDNTFNSGQFGFYNNSQQNVRYAGFEFTPVVPEPETYMLMLAGLFVVGGIAAKRRRAG